MKFKALMLETRLVHVEYEVEADDENEARDLFLRGETDSEVEMEIVEVTNRTIENDEVTLVADTLETS